LTAIVTLSKNITERRYHSAFAIGVGTAGRIQWGGTWQWKLPSYAAESAIELCQRAKTDVCKVVLANGEYKPKEFIEFARKLGGGSIDSTRRDFVAGIRSLPAPIMLMIGSTSGPPTFGYASPLSADSATAPSPAVVANPAMHSAEWAPRRTALEKGGSQVNFARAVTLLLDVSTAEELALLREHEAQLARHRWANGYAMGADANGNLVWGGGYGLQNAANAAETAVEQCSRSDGAKCMTVLVNGEFRLKEFNEVARQLGGNSVAATREAFMQSLRKPLAVTSNSPARGPEYGVYTSSR
jgi:hypothetical protein